MKQLAALLMFVAWLLSGAIPATGALTPISFACDTQITRGDHPNHQARHHDGVQQSVHGSTVGTFPPACAMAFCTMCLTVLPIPPGEVVRTTASFSFVQDSAGIFVSSEPRRLERPPRAFG